jgi:ribose transport system substrate-binding protein
VGAGFIGAVFLAAVALTLGSGTARAEDPACKPHDVDLGDGKSAKAGCGKLKIAVVIAASNNVYLQANIQGAKDAAAKNGAELDVFDANWSPVTQFNLIQNALTGGKYNAVLTGTYEGEQYCRQVTEDAVAKNMLVVIANSPACGRSTNEGAALWAPGTLAFVGGTQGRGPYRDWLFEIAEQNPGPKKVAVITGPDGIANTINTNLAIEDVQKKYPDFKIVGVVRTDYSVKQGFEKFAPFLQANPDLDIIISNYSDMTRGAMQAIAQPGLSGKPKIYDFGGNKWAFEAVRRGDLVSTKTMTPYAEYYRGVDALASAWKGETVPRYLPLQSAMITKDNIDKFKPEF